MLSNTLNAVFRGSLAKTVKDKNSQCGEHGDEIILREPIDHELEDKLVCYYTAANVIF